MFNGGYLLILLNVLTGITLNDLLYYFHQDQEEEDESVDLLEVEELVQQADRSETDGGNTEDVIQLSRLREGKASFNAFNTFTITLSIYQCCVMCTAVMLMCRCVLCTTVPDIKWAGGWMVGLLFFL